MVLFNFHFKLKKITLLVSRSRPWIVLIKIWAHEDGNPYIPIGTNEIAILDENQLLSLEAKIDSLSQGYMSDENKQRYIAFFLHALQLKQYFLYL